MYECLNPHLSYKPWALDIQFDDLTLSDMGICSVVSLQINYAHCQKLTLGL